MRIALHISNLDPGGAQNVMLRLAGELGRRGHSVTILPNSGSGFWQSALPDGVDVKELGAANLASAVPRLTRVVRETRSEALLSAMTQANISAVFAARFAGVPAAISERHACSQWLLNLHPGKRFLYRQLLPLAYRRAAAIIAQTRESAADLAQVIGVSRDDIAVIGNPVPPAKALSEKSPHPWLDSGEPVILGIGRLERQKNFALLIEAFARLSGPISPRLLILGEGRLKSDLAALAAALGVADRVEFTGQVENVHDYLARAALFVQSSNFEGFPNALLEALSAGRAVVATDCLTGPRELLDAGRLGALVPVGDAAAMAQAMAQALAVPGPEEPRRQWAAKYTLSSVTDAYEDLLMGMVKRRRSVRPGG